MLTRTFTPVWNKYRPAILRMMVDSENAPQSYRLSNHEFSALSSRKGKGSFSFSLLVSSGKAVNGLRDSQVAQDLWEILQTSPKATELIAASTFQFSMDKEFVLHVQKITQ